MGYGSRKPSSYPLMDEVDIYLDGMWLYLETQPLSVPPMLVTCALTVVLNMFSSDGTMERGRRYRNSLPQIRSLVVGLDGVWQYPEIPLSLGPFMMMIMAVIEDLVMCTPRLTGSGLGMAR